MNPNRKNKIGSFNASIFHNLGVEEYWRDVQKSPWHDTNFDGNIEVCKNKIAIFFLICITKTVMETSTSSRRRGLSGRAAFFSVGFLLIFLQNKKKPNFKLYHL